MEKIIFLSKCYFIILQIICIVWEKMVLSEFV